MNSLFGHQAGMKAAVEIKQVDPKEDFKSLAFHWRGQCIDCFARGEAVVSDCLEALRASELELSHESSHVGHQARARSLQSVLEEGRFRGHAAKALNYLGQWQDLYAQRVWLAHGVMTLTATAIEFRYRNYSGGRLSISEPLMFDRHSMKAHLDDLEKALWHLQSQLGQIKAACAAGDL